MEDQHGKYIRLFGTLFFTFIGFIVALILLLLGLRLVFGVLSYIPWLANIFTLFILCVPAALFISVFIIYFFRSKTHPSLPARIFSYIIFAAALASWGYTWVSDLITFFTHYYMAVGEYMSYNMLFLAANVLSLFFVAMIQGLSTKKEPDWMEKHKGEI
jgi:hypothetical protein